MAVCDLPEPAVPADGVIIDVKATGICRSDWHGWSGHDPDIHLPHVPGHEFSGVIEAVGEDNPAAILAAPDRVESLGAAILKLLTNPELAAAIARRALMRVNQEFAPALMAERYERLFANLVAQRD